MAPQVSAQRVLLNVYEKIIAGEIVTFDALVDEVTGSGVEARDQGPLISRAYRLLKRLNWGLFSVINPKDFKHLWFQLVVPHARYKGAGDLKRSMTISSVFIAMLDIHGYTAFCRESKTNLSKLHELDSFLSTTIADVANYYGCVGNRERGDELLLIGARAVDILRATFDIVQIFAKKRFFQESFDGGQIRGFSEILPPFQVSAGISGGNINTPMIITRKGEISGFLLNMAARLQTRANKLAPRDTKVILAKTVWTSYEKEIAAGAPGDIAAVLSFFDLGNVEFKGMSIPNMEAIFRSEDKYKLKLQHPLLTLFSSLKQNLWKDKVMLDLLELLAQTVMHFPSFNVTVSIPSEGSFSIDNERMRQRLMTIRNLFGIQEDFTTAIVRLEESVDIISQIPGFEPVILEYAREIVTRYKQAADAYARKLEPAILEKKKEIFQEQECKLFDYFRANRGTLERLEEKARKSNAVGQKRQLWSTVIEGLRAELDFSLYSGKK